jgi:hypothetical protein
MAYRRGQAYSQDLRDRVLAAPGSAAIVGARFGVSRSYVIKARQRRDRQGELCAGAQRSHTPAKLAGHDAALCQHVQSAPGAKLFLLPKYSPDLNPIEQLLANSYTCFEKPRLGQNTLFARVAENCSIPSRHKSAPTTLKSQAMTGPEIIPF